MNNIILLETLDKITLEDKVSEIKKNNNDIEVVTYDLQETPIERLVEDLDTYNFLSSKKLIIGTNATFLSGSKSKSIEHNLEIFEKYLNNPSSDNILMLVTDTVDKRKKICSLLLEKATVIETSKDIKDIIKSKLEDYKMDFNTTNLLIEYCGNDNERIVNELDKLKLYKLDEKVITSDDIKNLVMENLDDNIFHLIDAILSSNKKYAFTLYNNFLLHGEQVANIIRLLYNKIKLIYQVKVLVNDGNSDKSISKLLSVHEYPIKLARELSYKYSSDTLIKDIKLLTELDLKIKSGTSTGEVEFETFIASL